MHSFNSPHPTVVIIQMRIGPYRTVHTLLTLTIPLCHITNENTLAYPTVVIHK